METTLYLIRHGDVYNPKNIFYGRLPRFGLSEKGMKQIHRVADFLKTQSIHYIMTSPLLRARQSAEIIQRELGLPEVIIDDRLLEIRTAYQGRSFASLDKFQSELYLQPLENSDETISEIADRMQSFLLDLYKRYQGKAVAAVSHGDPIMILKAVSQNIELTFENFKINNGPYIQKGEILKIVMNNHEKVTVCSMIKCLDETV